MLFLSCVDKSNVIFFCNLILSALVVVLPIEPSCMILVSSFCLMVAFSSLSILYIFVCSVSFDKFIGVHEIKSINSM